MHNTKDKQLDKHILNTLETKECSLENDLLNIDSKLEEIKNMIYANNKSVIGVTAQYGGGKTFFAKCLQDKLDQGGIVTTKYIDLWKNDYKDPFITLASEMLEIIKDKEERNKFLSTTSNCIKSLLKKTSFGGSFFGFKVDIPLEDVKDMLLGKEKDEIKKLKEEIKKVTEKKKIVFLVDEIDRCRSEFAIEFLERIKHFFDIDNIVFILFINNAYINNLTCSYISNYGTSSSFISKFINKIIPLNFSDYEGFIKNIFHVISADFKDQGRYSVYYRSVQKIINYYNISLRDIKQIFINDYAKFIIKFERSFYADMPVSKDFIKGSIIFLIYVIKAKRIDEFHNIKNGNMTYLKNLIPELQKAGLYQDYIDDVQEYIDFEEFENSDSYTKEIKYNFRLML